MRTRVGINGMGQMGRALLRVVNDFPDRAFEVVAVNDTVPLETLAHLLGHDPPAGRRPGRIETGRGQLALDGQPVQALTVPDPGTPPWADLGVDIVIDAADERTPDRTAAHLAAGARKVVHAGPNGAAQVTIVIGINEDDYEPTNHQVTATASGSVSCAAAMVSVLHRGFGIRRGLVTTVRGDTDSDELPDRLRRDQSRAHLARSTFIPRDNDVITSLDITAPELAGRLDGLALRVPMAEASLIDLTVQLNEVTTPGQVNRVFAEAARGRLKSVLRYSTEQLISTDVVGDPASCVLDAGLTTTSGTMAKVIGWYDQLSGQAHRAVELVDLVARTLPAVRS